MTKINRNQFTQRQVKGLAIAGQKEQIKRITQTSYKVKSQSADTWYDVVYTPNNGWICTCPDHTYRKAECKHVQSVCISKQIRNKIVNHSDISEIESPKSEIMCVCGSMEVIKDGVRKNKSGTIQRFKCKSCKKEWSDNLGFSGNKVNSKVITMAIDLYFKGMSLRKVKEHIVMFHGVKVSHVAILGWIRKFGEIVTPFVEQFKPELSGVYHVDEMMIHVRKEHHEKGHYQWLWNMMDNTTKFWITSKVSQRREISDAQQVFKETKTKSPSPIAVVHDGLQSYNDAFNLEYYSKQNIHIENIRSVSVRHKGLNQVVERLNGTFREREKVMRGMNTRESSQKTINAFRTHYNFVRTHGSLESTPAERAGIKLDLGENKIETLIKLASTKTQI